MGSLIGPPQEPSEIRLVHGTQNDPTSAAELQTRLLSAGIPQKRRFSAPPDFTRFTIRPKLNPSQKLSHRRSLRRNLPRIKNLRTIACSHPNCAKRQFVPSSALQPLLYSPSLPQGYTSFCRFPDPNCRAQTSALLPRCAPKVIRHGNYVDGW